MDTQKLNNDQAPKKKGMQASTVAMTGAGIAAATVAGAAFMAGAGEDTQNEIEENHEAQNDQQVEENGQEELLAQNQQPTQPQQQEVNELTPLAPDQPGTNTNAGQTTENTTTVTAEVEPVDPEEAEALAIAQHLVGSDEIDPADIDAPAMAFVDTDVIYAEDGSEIPVALVNMPDSDEPFLLADIDGDRVYDFVVDTNGNIVAALDNALNVDDADYALTQGADYLAANEDSIQLLDNEDISDDIMVLDDGDLLADAGYTHGGEDDMMDSGYEEPDAFLDASDIDLDIVSDIG